MIRIFQKGLIAVLLFNLSCVAFASNPNKNNWGYLGNHGPAFWATSNPKFSLCGSGRLQSPISIPKKMNNLDGNLTIAYREAPLAIVNDGVTQLNANDNKPTLINDGQGVQLNFAANKIREVMTIDGTPYRLLEIHFHTPSEHALDGNVFPMELHFLHQSENGKILMVSVLVKNGQENAVIKKIIANIPHEAGKEHIPQDLAINPTELMPAKSPYYSYIGSLTTPPCIENVQWIVLQQPIDASSAQIAQMRKVMGGVNARPIQALNGRKILYSALPIADEKESADDLLPNPSLPMPQLRIAHPWPTIQTS